MLTSFVMVCATLWYSTPIHTFEFPISTTSNRTTMRLSATFSVASPDSPTLGNRIGETTPERPLSKDDSQIIFRHGDTIVTIAPGRIDKAITQGVLQMTLRMDQAIASEGKALFHDQNTIFSPASISMALALVLLGAQGNTLREVSRVLGIASPDDLKDRSDLVHEQFGTLLARFDRSPSANAPTQTSIANAIFIQKEYPIKERFERLSRSVYRSDIISVDFQRRSSQAAQTINKWVDDKTFGRIKGFLSSPPSADTQVLLASAIYFNGAWEHPFPIEGTRKRPFYVSGSKKNTTGSEVLEVPMMANALEVPYFNDANLDCQIVGLPYKGNKVFMWVVLPNARGFEGLNALKERLTVPVLDTLVSNTRVTPIIVSMPRMKLDATLNLRSTLQAMGLRSLFDPSSSDLGGISSGVQQRSRPTYRPPFASSSFDNSDDEDRLTFSSRFGGSFNETSDSAESTNRRVVSPSTNQNAGVKGRRGKRQTPGRNPGLYVDDVIHKVEIEVTETGTIASATTAVSIARDGSTRVVRLERPFLFFIRHEESKLMLFWGAIVRPNA